MTENTSKQNEVPRIPISLILRAQGASPEQIEKAINSLIVTTVLNRIVPGLSERSGFNQQSRSYESEGFNQLSSSSGNKLTEDALKTQIDREIERAVLNRLGPGSSERNRFDQQSGSYGNEGFNQLSSSQENRLLGKALRAQNDSLNTQKQLEAKLLDNGSATKEQLRESHHKQVEAINKNEMPDFKKLFAECGINPGAIQQAEVDIKRDLAYERMQNALERDIGYSLDREVSPEGSERDYRHR